jgi:hypothetical protein
VRSLSLAVAVLLGSSVGLSQAPAPAPTPAPAPARTTPADGGTTEVLQSIFVPALTNAPFSLILRTEWVRAFADGGTVTLVNHRAIMRDSAGHIFEERRLLAPKDGKIDSPLSWLQYADQNAHTLYECRPSTHVCYLRFYDPSPPPTEAPPGSKFFVAGTRQVDDLGRQMMSGMEVKGTRVTTTLNPHVMGNDRPYVTTREFWYSAQLGINLLSKRSDPRSGNQMFTVTDLSLTEPDPALFKPPEG